MPIGTPGEQGGVYFCPRSSLMLRILTYHRVTEPGSDPGNPSVLSATPAGFARQVAYLATHYAVISLQDVLHAVSRRRRLPRRAVLITFDDAYRDFAEVAWPILRGHRLPVTLFVPTAFPGAPEMFWWDRLYAAIGYTARVSPVDTPLGRLGLETAEERVATIRRIQQYVKTLPHAEAMTLVDRLCQQCGGPRVDAPKALSWDELRELASQGVTLASHTRTHPLLTRVPLDQVRAEIRDSLQDLRREIGSVLPIAAYPGGAYDRAVLQVLQEEGIKLAFTTEDGVNDPLAADPLRLRRTGITLRTSQAVFRLRLQPWIAQLDRWRHRRSAMRTV